MAKFGLDVAEAKPEPAKTKADERKATATKKGLAAAAAQPAALDRVGMDSDKVGISKIDVNSLTQEEFARLPESTLARLRGDFV